MIHGYDVSSWQDEHPDVSGQQFLFVKATQGLGYVNEKMNAQVQVGRSAGLVMGLYHYSVIANDPVAEADHFLNSISLSGGEILILDWEWYDQKNVADQKARDYKDAWLARVKAAAPDHKVILYTDTNFWKNVDQNSNCGDGLWIADYSHPAGQPPIEHPWLFHQYTESPIDQSVCSFSSLDELKAWAGNTSPVTPPGGPAASAAVPDWKRLVDHVISIPEQSYEHWNSNGGWDNLTPFGEEYGENGVAWCVIFDWDMYHDVGLDGIVRKTDNVGDFSDWARSKGFWSDYPSIGAWVNFGSGQHTEIVVGFDQQHVYTKGGNSKQEGGDGGQGNGVWSHTYTRTDPYVVGYFAPRFPDGVCPPTADPHDPRGPAVADWRWAGYSSPTRQNPADTLRQKEDAMGVTVVPLKTGFEEATVVPIPRVWVGDPDIPVGRVWLSLASDFGKVNLRVALFKPGNGNGDGGWRVLDSVVVDNAADAVRIDPWEGESKVSIVRKPLQDGDTADSTPCGVLIESILR